jgi:large subunit ribosomal protein L30e
MLRQQPESTYTDSSIKHKSQTDIINELNKMDINIDKALIKVIRTGKVIIGSNRTIDAVMKNEAKMVVLAANCPADVRAKIESTNVPILNYSGNGTELGPACGKPFIIAAMAIIDSGESDILAAAA